MIVKPQPELLARILYSVEEARAVWRALLAHSPASVYQTDSFLLSWLKSVGQADTVFPLFIVFEHGDVPVLFLPFGVRKKGPLHIAEFLGGKHANFNLPVFDPSLLPKDKSAFLRALKAAGRQAHIDVFNFSNQPMQWQGVANPLAGLYRAGIIRQESPSFGYSLALQQDAEAVIAARLSKDARKNLRRKENNLAKLGKVTCFEAIGADACHKILDAYFTQKAARFEVQGIKDPFDDTSVRDWLGALAQLPHTEDHAPLRLFGLELEGRCIAVWGVGTKGKLVSGMFTSFESTGEASRCSPGEILLVWLIRKLCSDGYENFDFGVGEARYKTLWCDGTIPLVDTIIAASFKGQLAARIMAAKGRIKRKIKQSPRIMALVEKMRVQLASTRRSSS